MAEPKVGMLFGTYNTLAEQNGKYYKQHQYSKKQEAYYGRSFTKIVQVWADPNNSRLQVRGHKSLDDKNAEYPANEADITVLYSNNINDTLKHSGSKRTESDDIIFDYIEGKNTYAKDLNGNGRVDNGEIFNFER